MGSGWRTVRVFLSSTFRDMHAERDHLVRFVFPRLRDTLLLRRIHLLDVDLRWGVTAEQDALEVCREVVDECRPRFLCILGGRYGWVPAGHEHSITAEEVRYGVLERLDQRGHAFFYFRDTAATAAMVETYAGEFRERTGSDAERRLAELKDAIVACGFAPYHYTARWDAQQKCLIGLASFGQQVYEDLLASIDREFGAAGAREPDELGEERAAMEAFVEERTERFVLGSRRPVLDRLLAHVAGTDGPNSLCLTGEPGSGKSALLATLVRAVTGMSDNPPAAISQGQQAVVVSHFVGASAGSADVRRTLWRLCHEIYAGCDLGTEKQAELGAIPPGENANAARQEIEAAYAIPLDLEALLRQYPRLLEKAAAKARVVLVIDAIDRFGPVLELTSTSWLPDELPPAVRIVLSTVPGPTLEQLRTRREPPAEVTLPPLTRADGEAIVTAFLHRYRKTMTVEQRSALLAKTEATRPLYLLAALEELRTLGTYEQIRDRIAELPDGTRGLFSWILGRLERDEGFRDNSGRRVGPELVRRFASLMAVSRQGLNQRELARLLAPGDLDGSPRVEDDPAGNVAALVQLLRPYLMRRGELLDFYHQEFAGAVGDRYPLSPGDRIDRHAELARCLAGFADPTGDGSWTGASPHALSELTHHLGQAGRWDEAERALTSARFVDARCQAGQVFELLSDCSEILSALPEAQAAIAGTSLRHAANVRWADATVRHARRWSEHRDQLARGNVVGAPDDVLPGPVEAVVPWSDDRIEEECTRVREHQTREDRIRAFAEFVGTQCYPLTEFGRSPGFAIQQAWNHQPAGTVHEAAATAVPSMTSSLLLRRWPPDAVYHPRLALVRTLEGHTDDVRAVTVTPDGQRAVSVGSDLVLRVWCLETGRCLRTIARVHDPQVWDVAVTPDNRRAVSAGWDGALRLWDLDTGACLRTLNGHEGWVTSVAMTPDGALAVSAGNDQTLRVWNVGDGRCAHVLHGHAGPVSTVAMTPDGRRAISGSDDGRLVLWDLTTGQTIRGFQGGDRPVSSVRMTPDGHAAISGGSDGTIRVWATDSGQQVHILEGHGAAISAVSMTPDGRYAISASSDWTLRLWDLGNGQLLRTFEGHRGAVTSVAVTPDGCRAVSGGEDDTVRVWNLESGCCARGAEGHRARVTSVSIAPNSGLAASSSGDHTVRIWDLPSGRCLRALDGHNDTVTAVCLTRDGQTAVSASWDGTLRVWDLASGNCLRVLRSHAGWVNGVCLTPDGRHAVSWGDDGIFRLWDLTSGECLRAFDEHTGPLLGVIVTPDGRQAISTSIDETTKVWNLTNGACQHTVQATNAWENPVTALAADGRRAVSAGLEESLHVWDVATGEEVVALAGPRTAEWTMKRITMLSTTPDGRRAASASTDGALYVWDLTGTSPPRVLLEQGAKVGSLTVTPDGRQVMSASEDGTLRMWSVDTGTCTATVHHPDRWCATAVAHDLVVAGDTTGNVVVFDASRVPPRG